MEADAAATARTDIRDQMGEEGYWSSLRTKWPQASGVEVGHFTVIDWCPTRQIWDECSKAHVCEVLVDLIGSMRTV